MDGAPKSYSLQVGSGSYGLSGKPADLVAKLTPRDSDQRPGDKRAEILAGDGYNADDIREMTDARKDAIASGILKRDRTPIGGKKRKHGKSKAGRKKTIERDLRWLTLFNSGSSPSEIAIANDVTESAVSHAFTRARDHLSEQNGTK